jgi:hypothetical protein
MSLEAGRAKLYSALKTLQTRWDAAEPYWRDVMKAQFVEQTLTPLQEQADAALRGVDQMEVVLQQMSRDCAGDQFDIYSSG